MRYESEEKKNLIFELMNGSLVVDEVNDPAKDQVQDEFSKGSYCSELYEEVYRAKVSLCDRLGVQEDNDHIWISFCPMGGISMSWEHEDGLLGQCA